MIRYLKLAKTRVKTITFIASVHSSSGGIYLSCNFVVTLQPIHERVERIVRCRFSIKLVVILFEV